MRNVCIYATVIVAVLLVVVIGGFPRPVKGDGGWVTGTPRECDQVPIATATQAPECYPTTATPAETPTRAGGIADPNGTPIPTEAWGATKTIPTVTPSPIPTEAWGATRRPPPTSTP